MNLMNSVFRKYLDQFVQVFLDDILIYSKNEKEHEDHLRIVLSCLRKHQLYGKLSKCSFFQEKIHYLGYIILGEGISIDPEKVKAIMEWPILKNAHQVQSFMGLDGYYRRFVEGFSKIAKLITTLQCKGVKYEWIEECNKAFSELKRLLANADLGGYWWPPTKSTWTPTIVPFSFSVSLIVVQFTNFRSFSGSELPKLF